MIKLVPTEAVAHYQLGAIYKLKDDNPAAFAQFETARDLNPRLAAPHFQLYGFYRQAGRNDQAAEELRLFQELKKQQEGAAIPEDMEWCPYAELYDPIEAPASAPLTPPVYRDEKLADGFGGPGSGVAALPGANGRPDLIAWSAKRVALFRDGRTIVANSGLEDLRDVRFVAAGDFNNDGLPDLCVIATTGAALYRNLGNGTFKDEGMTAGVAYGEDGVARGAMGADAADYDRSGRQHLLVGNFSNQMLGLYHNEGNGLFVDEAPSSTVGRSSLLSLSFGVFFFDYDLDGYPDILAVNGHIEDEIGRVQPKVSYRESPLLFRNLGNRRFDNVSSQVGPAFSKAIVARGAAYADFDHDGDLDVLISTNNGPAVLLRNCLLYTSRCV